MTDIASLGVKVESNLKTLNKDMEKTISLSEKVTDATNKINESFKSNVVEASKIIEAEKKKASAIDKMISSIKMQNIALVEGKSGLADYKLSILGASESQKKFAQDIISSMESVRSARKSESEQVKSNLSNFKTALSEQAKVSQMAQDAEKARLSSINSIIDSLSREEKSLSMTKEEQIRYNLALLGASDAEKKLAQDIQNRINAIKDSEKAQKQAAAQEKEAAKIASKLAQEQAQAQKQIADAETKRKDSINGIILKLRDEAATVGKSKAELTQYQLTLLGASEAEKKEAAALQNRIKAMQDANSAAKSHDSVLGSLITRLSALGAAYFGVQSIKNFASSLIDTAKIMDSYKYSLLAVSENSTQAAETYEYLRKEADRLGLSLVTQEKAFTGFAAAAKQSGLRVEETRSIYTGLMEAMTAIHRSPEEASQALKAFQDMLSKGTIQAEELKKQLGNALPGAMAYMSDATGKSTAELMKMMEQGILPAKEGLIVLSDYLSNKFQLSAEGAANSMQGSLNKMENAWYELKAGIVEAMGSNTTGIIKDVTDTIKNMTDQLKDPEVQRSLKDISDAIKVIGEVTLTTTQYISKMILSIADVDFAKNDTNEFVRSLEVYELAKKGVLDFAKVDKATTKERIAMLDELKAKQDEFIISLIDSAKSSETATDTFSKGWLRVSGAQVLSNKEMFAARGLTQEQGEELKKLTDKIKEQAEVAGKTDIQIMEGNLRKLTSDEALIKSQLDLMKSSEAKNQAVKDADKASREAESAAKKSMEERKRAAEQALKVEEDRRNNIADIIKKLQEERDTLDMTKEQLIAYKLALLGATPAQIAFAQAIQKEISAAEERKRVTADFKSLQEKLNPELKRQNDLMADFKVVNDAYAMGLIKTKEEADKLKESLEFNSFSGAIDELKDKLKFEGTNFGNEMADGINNAVISMQKLNDQLDKQAKNQKDIDKLQKEIDTTSNLDLRAKKQKKMDELTEDSIKSQMSGYRQLFGTASQLFKENSREREVMHNIEMAFAAAEIAMNLEKTISAAYLAIAESGTLPPPASFAAIAAMTALMAGIVAAAGGSLSGGGSASAPSVSASSTQGTGTVMGNPSEKSQSANNALEFMKDIEAKQYNELRDINKGVVDLNNNITNLVTSIVRTGAGTGDMGIKTGVSGGTSNIQKTIGKAVTPWGVLGIPLDLINTVTKGNEVLNAALNTLSIGLGPVNNFLTDIGNSIAGAVFGGTKKTSILAQGLEVSTAKIGDLLEGAGLDIQKFADIKIKKSGGIFGSDKTYLKTITESLTPDEESIKIMFTNVFKNVGETMVAISKELNLGDDKLKEIYSHVFDIGKIDLKGMDTEQINEAISSVINTASDQAVTALFGELIGKYVQVGEALLETAIRVVSERAVVLDILEMTGQGFKDSDIPEYSLEVTQSLISVAGGIKELQDASATYYDKFFTDSEKQIRLQGQLTETMASMGQSMPTTRDGLRKIVESLDLTTEAGQRGYVTLLGLSESFDSVFSKIEADNEKKLELELQIMNLTGQGAEALAIQRQKEIDSLSEANKPLQERIYALQDEAAANKEATDLLKKQSDERIAALKAEAVEREAIQNKKFDLEIQILKLTGKETEATALLRQKEIDSLADVNKPLQERINTLTDEAKEIEKINSINKERTSLEIELLNATGKTVEATAMSRQIELASMDESLRSLKLQIWAANDLAAANELSIKSEQERINAIKEASDTAKQIAQEQLESAKSMLKDAVDAKIEFLTDLENKAKENLQVVKDLLQRSFEYEKNKIVSDHENLIKGLTSRLDEAKTAASDLEGVFNSLSSARKSMFVAGSETGQYKEIQKELFKTLQDAIRGDFSGVNSISEKVGGLSGNNQSMFTTEEEYKRDFFKTYRALSELEELTGTQLTEQQQIVKKLETQIEIDNVNNKLTLESLQDQYDAVLGVDKSVVSFADAVVRYQKAQYEANGANALLKEQTEILTNQMNTLFGINQGIISVNEAIEKLVFAQAAITASEVPEFANGGYHSGGPMLVGERGIEVINAPPAMVTSNNDLKSIMSNEEVVAELKAMRTELARANFELVKNSSESKKTLREWQEIGVLTRTA